MVSLPIWALVSLGVSVLITFLSFVFTVWRLVNKLQSRQVETSVATLSEAAAKAKDKADENERSLLKLKADLASVASLSDAADEAKDKADENERALLKLRADLPLHYVRREDWIRNQTVIEAKLDALAAKLENMGGPHGS